MSSDKTENLNLHKWQISDKVDYNEINENFTILDESQKGNSDKFTELEASINKGVVDANNLIDSIGGSQELLKRRQNDVETKQVELEDFIIESGMNNHSHNNGVILDGFNVKEKHLYYNDELVKTSDSINIVSWVDITNKPAFADVSITGDYNDLENRPVFPTKVSQLENDRNYANATNIPTKISQLINDSDFITGLGSEEKLLPRPIDIPTLEGVDGYAVVYNETKNTFELRKIMDESTGPGKGASWYDVSIGFLYTPIGTYITDSATKPE